MPKIFKDKNDQEICRVYETNEIQANPETLGNEQALTSLKIGSTKYKVEGGGSTVVPNPVIIGVAPTLTGLQINGDKYKVPQGGGGGSDYTAGDGIEIADDVISVDRTSVQKKLVAGDNIKIDPVYVGDPYFEQIGAENWPPMDGFNIWTDGENVYYSDGVDQCILDKATSTWSPKTWSGLTTFSGINIWTDGNNIYYSYGSNQYILDKATSTWNPKTWYGLTSFSGFATWTDGENIYFSSAATQYVLDKSTSTWNRKTWYGNTLPQYNEIWTDGQNIYCSGGSRSHYVLDKATSTWNPKTWYGLTQFSGSQIWTDGKNIYCSNNTIQYVLDKETSTWLPQDWGDNKPADAQYIWTDGKNTYYSSTQDAQTIAYGSYILIKGEVDPDIEEISFSSSLTEQGIADLFSKYLDSNASFVENVDPTTGELNYTVDFPRNASYEANATGYTLVVDTDDANLENDTAVFGEN